MSQTKVLPSFLEAFSLEGKVALITGGTGGIGLGLTEALAGAGADVISLQLPSEPHTAREAVEALGRKAWEVECDLSKVEQLADVIDRAFAFATPDIVVNCAGIVLWAPTTVFPVEQIELVIRINCIASLVIAREVVKRWETGPIPNGKKIINFASISSFRGDYQNVAYVASKGAVLQMTRGMSNEWAPLGIQVNCIAPGYTKSRMTENKYNDEEYNKKLLPKIPARRWGTSADLQGTLIYLASGASNYVTGTCAVVDGGVLGGPP